MVKNKNKLYLFFDQDEVRQEQYSLKNIISAIYNCNDYKDILKNNCINIIFHDKHIDLNLSVTRYSNNPWGKILNDANMLEIDRSEEKVLKRKAETQIQYLIKNYPQINEDNLYTIKIDSFKNIELNIKNFYIFRHDQNSICYQFIRDIVSGKFNKNFPENYKKKIDYSIIKNRLISLWLPLAIDIQGLSEVIKDNDKAKKYWREIKKNNTTDLVNLIEKHDKIAKNTNLKLDNNDKNQISRFLKSLNSKKVEDLPDSQYLKPDGDFFFPNWFMSFINKFNNI